MRSACILPALLAAHVIAIVSGIVNQEQQEQIKATWEAMAAEGMQPKSTVVTDHWGKAASDHFAEVLEKCIRNAAAEAAASFSTWGNSCHPPTEKIDRQAEILKKTLAPIRDSYGYPGALWCAFYSVVRTSPAPIWTHITHTAAGLHVALDRFLPCMQRMTGQEFDPNSDQPNNPNIDEWYNTLLCPYDLATCGEDELGTHGNEWQGVAVADFATNQNGQYLTHPCKVDKPVPPGATQSWAQQCRYIPLEENRRTMSCGLCGRLRRRLGKAPFTITPPPVHDPGQDHLYTQNLDFHPFGAWLANDAGWDVDETVPT